MKINYRSPRYMLPMILLPFLCLFFYAYKQSFGKDKAPAAGRDSLQYAITELPEQGLKSSLKDKLDAYRAEYKKADGYTAINSLEQDTMHTSSVPSLYNDKEKRILDSIQKAVSRKYANSGQMGSQGPVKLTTPKSSDQALAEALNRMQSTRNNQPAATHNKAPDDPMQLFRQQMALVDSMERSHDPEYKAAQQKKQQSEQLAKEQVAQKKLSVSKAQAATAVFNTIKPDEHNSLISAIIDQDVTGYAGSRIRIRLLDDLMAGQHLIRKGTYLYAQISGFTGQRVLLTITSILQGDQILPVKLDVYDNDGLAGLYVPASAFRDFSKDLGSSSSQGLTMQQSADQNNQLVMSLAQRMFESTTTAVSKLIRKNKAKLKYNTLVYLIDPESLRNHQQQMN